MDTSYDVIKVNKFGQKMRRTIKLTQHHVISIKNGSEITKFYAFSDIRVIWLENQDTVNIQQRSNKMNVYMSPIAPHILQQVTTRVKVRAALDKAEVGALCLAASPYTHPYIHTLFRCPVAFRSAILRWRRWATVPTSSRASSSPYPRTTPAKPSRYTCA